LALQISKLLIRERLERRRVDNALPARERQVAPELADHRLSRTRWCGHHNGATTVQRIKRLQLEIVEIKREDVR
jgi:hypothetical protein